MNSQHARQVLLAAKAEIEARLERTHRHIHHRETASPNFHEQIVQTGNDAVVQVLEQEGRHELRQIEKALQRVDSGQYPWCVVCGKAIGQKRLQVLPWTTCCIDCA